MARRNLIEKPTITNPDGAEWGFITLIPFGWLILWANINSRRKEVEKGIRDKESAVASIKNYAIGAAISLAVLFIYFLVSNSNSAIVVPNFIALFVLTTSILHNIFRIYDFNNENATEYVNERFTDNETEDKDSFLRKANTLKNRLEQIDEDDDDYEIAIQSIRNDIDDFYKTYKDCDFPDGGKYKIYELKAEYFFVAKNKTQAKKYIQKAVEIREQEKNRENAEPQYDEEDDYEI